MVLMIQEHVETSSDRCSFEIEDKTGFVSKTIYTSKFRGQTYPCVKFYVKTSGEKGLGDHS